MDAVYSTIGILLGLFFVLAQIFAWVAVFQIRNLKKKVAALEAMIAFRDALSAEAQQSASREGQDRPDETGAPEPPPTESPEPEADTAPEAETQWERPAAAARASADEVAGEIPPVQAARDGADLPPTTPRQSWAKGIEQELASRWLVWLGAVAVGLSAIFLFSYAVEQGWLGPVPRVVLGLFLGAALIAGGEWTHRHPLPGLTRAMSPDYVPQALTASGVFALYASIYAAYAIFALLGIAAAFTALAAVSFAGLILAVRQGWLVALIGLAGGYAVPALLGADAPAAIPVFVYLFVLTTGCLAVMRFRDWPFLAVATLAGSIGWPLLWFAGTWTIADQGPLSLYAVATAAVFALLSIGFPVKRPATRATAWLAAMIADTSGLGFVAHGAIVVLLAVLSGYNPAAFVFLGLYAGLGLAFALRRAAYESLGVASAIIVAVAFLLWPQPDAITIPDELARHGVENYGDTFGPMVMPAEFLTFARAAVLFAAFYGIGGFAALKRAATPPVWSALSAALPLYLLALAYWRIGGFELNLQWGAIAAGLSFAQLAAASMVERRVGRDNLAAPLSFYAAGATAALALAFACVLREAWLTVALSLEVLALGWIWSRLGVRAIRTIAWAVAAVVIVRLVANHRVIDYEGGVTGLFSWVVYGYGVPAAAFLGASRLFGDARRDPLAALCEAGAAGFGFLLVALQLRIWTSGAIYWADYGLFDQSVQSIWWLLAAGLLLRREVTARSAAALYGGWVLLALAAVQIVLGHLIGNNPLLTGGRVGEVALFNLLGLAYLAPAVLVWLLSAGERFALHRQVRQALRIAAGVLVFAYLTLEVRRAFHGSVISLSPERMASNAEIYAYSAVWIAYSLVLLALGILRDSSLLRYASLTVLIVTVAKVFLYDMSDLTGLYRVASFLGLGLTMIGIGYVYRRFVFRPPPQEV
ncbi:MAG: DUF2339 domain-containing protein [Alphaproteobacteria bacterium]